MKRAKFVFIVAFALLLAACGEDAQESANSEETTPDAEEEVAPQPLLEDGGIAISEAGVAIGADKGALDQFVAVSVDVVEKPGDQPLPSEASTVGNFFEIGAGRNVELSASGPGLYVAVPVPDEANPENVALAIRSDKGFRPHAVGDQLEVDALWTVVSGMYDPDGSYLVVPIHFLMRDGFHAVLVESSDYSSVELPAGPPASAMSNSGDGTSEQALFKAIADAVTGAVQKGKEFIEEGGEPREDFFVKCRAFDDGECTDTEKEAVRQFLLDVYDDFVDPFNRPDLRRTIPGREVDGQMGRYYIYVLRKDDTGYVCNRALGMYNPVTNTATSCWNGEDDLPERTTRMEFFHAVQYNYAPVSWTNGVTGEDLWITEGTASFVENTDSTAIRALRDPNRSLRAIDIPLTQQDSPGVPEYEIQDFWVYLSEVRDLTPEEMLIPLFDQLSDGPNQLGVSKVDTLFNLRDAYWGWVRNQAFEGTATDGNQALADTCVPNDDAWTQFADTFAYNTQTAAQPLSDSFEVIEPWSSNVYEVTLSNTSSEPAKLNLRADATDPFGFVEVYRDRSSATPDCLQRDDDWSSAQFSEVLDPNDEVTVYVLATNATSSEERPFSLEVDHLEPSGDDTPPTVTLVEPRPTDGQEPRPVLNLLVDASDPGFIASYEWTVANGSSSITYEGNDLAVYPYGEIGGGELDISCKVTDDEGDSVTVTVTRNVTPGG